VARPSWSGGGGLDGHLGLSDIARELLPQAEIELAESAYRAAAAYDAKLRLAGELFARRR